MNPVIRPLIYSMSRVRARIRCPGVSCCHTEGCTILVSPSICLFTKHYSQRSRQTAAERYLTVVAQWTPRIKPASTLQPAPMKRQILTHQRPALFVWIAGRLMMLIDSLKSLVQFVCMDCWKVNDANRQPKIPGPVCLYGLLEG